MMNMVKFTKVQSTTVLGRKLTLRWCEDCHVWIGGHKNRHTIKQCKFYQRDKERRDRIGREVCGIFRK